MMNAKREKQMQPIALAALILGIFSVNPAHAVERHGMSWAELQTLTGNSFEVIREGNSLRFAGMIPAACAEGATATYAAREGKHHVTLDFPLCRDGRAPQQGGASVPLSSLAVRGLPISFNANQSGQFVLSRMGAGDPNSRRPAQTDPLLDIEGNQISHTSQADIDRRNQDLASQAEAAHSEAQRAERDRQLEARRSSLVGNLTQLCRSGQFEGLGAAIEGARDFLGDVTDLLERVGQVRNARMEREISRARNVDDARSSYDALIAVSGGDEARQEIATRLLITRMVDLTKENIEGVTNRQTAEDAATAVRNLRETMRELDVFRRTNREQIAWMYSEIATKLRASESPTAEDFESAERYTLLAMDHSNADSRLRLQTELSRMWMAQYNRCLEANRLRPAQCDRFANKARTNAERAVNNLANRGSLSDEQTEVLNGMRLEQIQTFGNAGYRANVQGIGQICTVPQACALVDQAKIQSYQEGIHQLQRQQQMRMSMQQGQGFPGLGAQQGAPGMPNMMQNSMALQGGVGGQSFFR